MRDLKTKKKNPIFLHIICIMTQRSNVKKLLYNNSVVEVENPGAF